MSVYATMVAVSDDTAGNPPHESRHVSVWIECTAAAAYEFISDPENLPRWVAGLDLAAVDFEFAPLNEFGVLDHVVRVGGEAFYNPMRVLPAGVGHDSCELVFSVRRRAGMSDDEFDADAAAVAADLHTLRGLLQG
ncbi:SRPBCC family protein [soil metagenome]